MVTIHTELLPLASTGRRPRTNAGVSPVTTVTIHDTQNPDRGAGAETHSRVQHNGSMPGASWHATVDEKGVWVDYADADRCWHAGQATGNNTSYGIEIAVNSDGEYPAAVHNAATYAATVLARHGLGVGALRQHNAWTGKDCPEGIRAGRGGITWSRFKSLVQAALDGAPTPTPAPTTPVPAPTKPTAEYPHVDLLVDGDPRERTWTAFQRLMAACGYYSGRIDGDPAHLTITAMERWLAKLGYYTGRIEADHGERAVRGPVLIRALQSFLYDKGFYRNGTHPKVVMVDGKPGPRTWSAFQQYLNQQRKHLLG